MAFKFGLIQSIDPTITLICFIVVVAFIIFFEHATEVLEYLLEENQMYSKIVQVIYKELMLMGVISFSIIMYQASKTGESSEKESTIIVAIDFAHIILFYMTIFFVVHAMYLIRISIYNHRRNRGHFARSIKSLVEQIEALEQKPWWHPARWLFHSDLLLLSSLRNKAEFKIVQTIFQALYLVPRNFNYPAYISGCYERYALKTTNRSLVSWFILLVAILVNYLRLFIGYNCTIHHYSGSSHRLLGSSSSDSSTSLDAHEIQREDDLCRKLTMREFLVVGALITVYNLGVLIASRVYKLRLVKFSGVKTSGDILGYLKYLDSFEEDYKKEIKATKRFTTKQLLSEIETTLNEMEHDEEEESVRLLASVVTHSFAYLRSAVGAVRYNLRLLLVSVFCPKRRHQKLLRRQTSTLLSSSPSKTAKLTRTAEMHHGLSNVSPAELECVATATPECLAAVVQQGGDFAAVCPLRKTQGTEGEDSDAGSKVAATSGSLKALWPTWLPGLWPVPPAHDSGRTPAALEGGSARTFRLYRHKSTLLTMMREQRPFAAIQQRVCVHMDEDLPLATMGLHRAHEASAQSPTAADAADDPDRLLAPDEENEEEEDDPEGDEAVAIDTRRAQATVTALGLQPPAQLHGGALSSSTNSSTDALLAAKTPARRQSLSEAKQRRLRAAAASFYYQQRMTNWLVEQQQLGGRTPEADDDVPSDESDSGDNSSPRDDSGDGEDYGEVVADDPSIAHTPRVFAAALQSQQHAPPATVMHAAAHHIAPPLLIPPPIDVAALPPTATSPHSSSRRTQLSGVSVGVHSSAAASSRRSATHSPSSASHRSTTQSAGSAHSPSRTKHLCAVRSYREMVKASEEAKEPPATLGDVDLARLEEGACGGKPASSNESKAEDALLDELLHELGPLHPSGASAASGANGGSSAMLTAPVDHLSEQAEADGLQHASGKTVPEQFRSIFFLQRPELFFRAIELSIMFSCLFMALWVTNMISIVRDIEHATYAFVVLAELLMVVPILLHFYTLPSITETCALITALYQLDLHVAKDVLSDAVETSRLVKTVRRKILARTAHQVMLAERMQRDVRDEIQRRELDHQVHRLLHLDQDIARLRHVHDKRALLVKRLHRRLHQLQTGGGHAAHIPAEADAKLKALRDEVRTEAKRLRHATKKLATAQDERARAWREFETLKEAIDNTDLEQRRRFIDELFEEMDQDGSGSIDRDEFREMLRQLQLTLSDHKFRLLFRAIDSANGDGSIQREELHTFLFPPASVMLLDEAREARRRADLVGGDEDDAGHSEQFYRYAAPSSPVATPQSPAAPGLHQRKPQPHADDRDLGIDVTVKTPKRSSRAHSAARHEAHHPPRHHRASHVAVGKHAHPTHHAHVTGVHRPPTGAAHRKTKKDRHAHDGDLSSHSSDSSDY